MRRGAEPSAPNSGPPTATAGFRGQPGRRAKRPADELSARAPRGVIEQPQPSLRRTLESQPQPLPPSDAQRAPRAKSPSYLAGKNPYGRILDHVEHPYREQRSSAPGPPSQLGSDMGGRPRTSGSFKFTTRPTPPAAPERKVSVDGPPTPPPLPPKRPPQKTFSVKDAKSFFERKASESQEDPPVSPAGNPAATQGASTESRVKQQTAQIVSRMRITGGNEEARPAKEHDARWKSSGPSLPVPRPPTQTVERRQSTQRTNPFTRAKADNAAPEVVLRSVTGTERTNRPLRRRKSPGRSTETADYSNSESLYAAETSASARRRSTNVFSEPKPDPKPLRGVQRSVMQHDQLDDVSEATRNAIVTSKKPMQPSPSDETVRRRSTRKTSTAETDEARPSLDSKRNAKAQRAQTGHAVRRVAGEFDSRATSNDEQRGCRRESRQDSAVERHPRRAKSAKKRRRQDSRSVPIDQESDANESVLRSRRRSTTMSELQDLDHDIETYVHNFGEPIQTAEKLEEIATKSLSHDGSSSHHSLTRRASAQAADPSANVGVEEGYYSIEVPNHVDWRGGYGRRKTLDFGFPGARIKPRSTFRTYKSPLQNPGNWIKRACGHFSSISAIEPREEAAKKPCSECRAAAPPQPTTSKHHRSRRRAATDSSTNSSHSSKKDSRSRRQHHSECISGDKCGDTFARDLGYIIDSILEEHQNTLQNVINNIKFSQPNLAQLRRVSEDLVNRCKSGHACSGSWHSTCQRPVCSHTCQPCQPVCQPCQPCQSVQQVCDWQPPCPYVPPKAAEKLNVGEPGQLGPNLNDSKVSLRESIRSAPELVELVQSAADDLGVDLDRKPTSEDDTRFEEAPVERSPQQSPQQRSSISRHSIILEPVVEQLEEKLEEEFQLPVIRKATDLEHEELKETQESEDAWLQKTRRQLTQLSETRSQLMDELDTIAEDLGVHLEERRRSSASIDPIQRVLSRVSTSLSRKATRLRNKSVDSVADEIPRIIDQEINERRLSRVLTRISTQSRRISMVSQGMLEVEAIPPEEIQAWLECAQTELPAAIDSITAVMETLPTVETARPEPEYEEIEEIEEQPEYEEGIQYEENEPLQEEFVQEDEDLPPETQEQVADIELDILQEDVQPVSEEYSDEEEALRSVERVSTENADFQAPVMKMLKEEVEVEEKASPIQRMAGRQIKLSPLSRKSTQSAKQDLESLSPVSWGQEGEAIEEEIELPVVERVASRRTLPLSRQSTVGRTPSLSSVESETQVEEFIEEAGLPIAVIERIVSRQGTSLSTRKFSVQSDRAYSFPPEERDLIELEQKIIEAEPEPGFLSKRSTRRGSLPPPPSPEPEAFTRMSTKKSIVVPSRPPTVRDPEPEGEDFQAPVMRKATGVMSIEVEPDVLSRHSTKRKSLVIPPSPNPKPISPIPTRKFTVVASRRSTIRYPESEEDFEPPVVRKATKVLEEVPESGLEPEFVSRVSTRKSTIVPSRRSIIQEPATEEIEEVKFEPPVVRKATSLEIEEEPAAQRVSRATTRKSTFFPSRRSTIQELSPPEEPEPEVTSRASTRELTIIPSRRSTIEVPAAVELEDVDFQPPVVRKATGMEPEEAPEPELVSRIPMKRSITIPSRQPTIIPSRRSTMEEPSPAVPEDVGFHSPVARKATGMEPEEEPEPQPELVSRVSTRRPTTLPSRKPTFQEPSPPVEVEAVSRVSTRRSTIVPSRRPTTQELSPESPSEEVNFTPPVMRKASGIEPEEEFEPEPEIASRKPTRKSTFQEPDLLSRVPTRKLTVVPSRESTVHGAESVIQTETVSRTATKEPTTPPSRKLAFQEPELEPETEEEFVPSVMRKATGLEPEPGPESELETISRTSIRKPTAVFSRRPTELERQPTFSYETPVANVDTEVEEEVQPPVIRKATVSDEELESQILSQPPTRKSTVPPSRQPTVREFERQPTHPYEDVAPEPGPEVEDFHSPVLRKVSGLEDEPESVAISRVLTRKSTAPLSRRATLERQPTVSSIPEPTPDDEVFLPPVIRKVTTRRPTTLSRQPSSLEVEPEIEPIVRRATTERPPELERQVTLSTEAEPEIEPFFRKATTRRPTELVRQQTVTSAEPELEDEEFQPPVVREVTTRRPTELERQVTLSTEAEPEIEPVFRKTTTRRPNELVRQQTMTSVEPELEDEEFQPPVVRKVTTRRPTELERQVTLSTEAEPEVEPVLRRTNTRRPTELERQLTLTLEEAEPEVEPEIEDFQPPVVRKVTTRRPTEKIPSPAPIIRHATTRRPTVREREQPVVQDSVPPATSRKPTEAIDLSASESSSIYSHPTSPGEGVIRRRTTIEVIPDQEVPSHTTTMRTLEIMSTGTEFTPPVMRAAVTSPSVSCAPTRHPSLPTRRSTMSAPMPSPEELVEDIPVERVSREPSRVSRRPTEIDLPPLSDSLSPSSPDPMNEGPSPTISRKVTREPTTVSRQPTTQSPPSRQPTTFSRRPTTKDESPPSTMPVMRIARADTEPEAESEFDPEVSESESELPISSRKSSVQVSRKPTRAPSVPVSRKSTARDESPPSAMPVMRMARADTEPAAESEFDPEASEPESPPPPSRKASTQVSRKSTRVATAPLERKLTEVLERQRTLSEETVVERAPTRQPTDLEKIATRIPTERALETEVEAPSPRQGTVSRRATEVLDRQPTEVVERVVTRRPTKLERKTTRVPSERTPPREEEDVPTTQRPTTGISRQNTSTVAPVGIIQRDVEPEPEAGPPLSPSPQASVLDGPLAALDVYHGSPAPSTPELPLQEDAPKEPSRAPTRRDTVRSRRQSTVEDVPSEEKTVRIQDQPTASYSPPRRNERELAPDESLTTPITRIVEQSTPPTEEIPEQEPGRLDRPPTADLSRDPHSLAPPLERRMTSEPQRRRSTMPRVLTSLAETQKKPGSAAPGIVAPPTQDMPKKMKSTPRAGKPRKAVNVLPEQQHPPAPEYPIRDTPTWTKPDTHTPPPKPMEEPPTKAKRGWFGFGSKPKPDPQPVSRVQREPSPEPRRDREPVRPFRYAAPGGIPGPPGGTQQRPRGYPTAPGREPIFLARKVAPPISAYAPPPRRDSPPPRQGPAFARKDDYYPRLPPPLPERRDSHPRPRPAVRHDIYSQPSPAPVKRDVFDRPPAGPARRDLYLQPPPAPVRRDVYSQPSSARYDPPSSAYRQPPFRQEYPPRNEIGARSLRGQAPEPARYQPQTQQGIRDQAKAAPQYEAPLPLRRAPTDKQSSLAPRVPQETPQPGSARRDAQRSSQTQDPQDVPSTQSGNIRRPPTSRNSGGRASQIPQASAQTPQGQSAEQRRWSSAARGSQQGRKKPQAEESSQEDFGSAASSFDTRTSMDGTSGESGRPSIDQNAGYQRSLRARTALPRASTFSALDAARRISAAGQSLKPTADSPGHRPFPHIDATKTIPGASQVFHPDRRSNSNPEGLRSGSTTPRAISSRAGTPRKGTTRPESRRESVAKTPERSSGATTRPDFSRRASTPGEESTRARETPSRRPSTALETRSPTGIPDEEDSEPRRPSSATVAQTVSGTTIAPSGRASPISEASSATVTPASHARLRDPEQGVQRSRSLPTSTATVGPSRTRTSGEEPRTSQSRTGRRQLQGQSGQTPAPPAVQSGEAAAGAFSRKDSTANVPRRGSTAPPNSPVRRSSTDDARIQPTAHQRDGAKRRDSFIAEASPKTPLSGRTRSFWGRRDKSESPTPTSGGQDERRDEDVGGRGGRGEDRAEGGGGQGQNQKGKRERVGATVVGGQGVNLGLGKRWFGGWGRG